MAIPIHHAIQILESYKEPSFDNLFAQSYARSVLYETAEEDYSQFPQFDPKLTDKATIAAYAILSAGVSLAENGIREEAIKHIERAGALLNNTHRHDAKASHTSGFHTLVAAMAFYSSGQYSKAFVAIKNIELQTDLAKMISAFLLKRPKCVIRISNPYLLADLAQFEDYDNICEHAVTVAVSRALSLVLEYFASGDELHYDASQSVLDTALSIASNYRSPALWWIVRLLKLVLADSRNFSMWELLPPYFPENSDLLDRYIRLLLFGKIPVIELWQSQRKALEKIFHTTTFGAVINMRTSAGKTRIAELAILQELSYNSRAKILYLAPFRSLAFELEETLSRTFTPLGFQVSHLYGGYRVSAADKNLSQDSQIIIATPEKARALLRQSPELFDDIKLIVADEGHLISTDKRDTKNEFFLDHLRFIASTSGRKMMMLSAVLPNSDQFAKWLTGDASNVAISKWKPSSERLGLLRWSGSQVRIEWQDEFKSFVPNFITSKPLGWGKRRNKFPIDKREAVAAAAVRLSKADPVMIFSARANAINGYAEAVLMALGETPEKHLWKKDDWLVFKTVCEEELSEDAIELRAARSGVICHSNRLPTQVRIATERLMRSNTPKIIIASQTLGQGVNVGVSSVIIANVYYSSKTIGHRDFWNICGRAGRAFVDGEGKILYAIDNKKVRKNLDLAREYFQGGNYDPVVSGLLSTLDTLYCLSQESGIDFQQLLQMVAENDFSNLDQRGSALIDMDLIDDSLLAFQEDSRVNPEQLHPEEWVDDVFRNSLASIQSEDDQIAISQEQLLSIIKARLSAIIKNCPDASQRKVYVATGLPLSSAKNVYLYKEYFIQQAQVLIESKCSPSSIITFLKWLEDWARQNAKSTVQELPPAEELDLIRGKWIKGIPMRAIIAANSNALKVCKDSYGLDIPWLVNAIVQLLRASSFDEQAKILENIGLLIELGVPNMGAAMIFLAGIHSRVVAIELSQTLTQMNIDTSTMSASEVKGVLRNPQVVGLLRAHISEPARIWFNLYQNTSGNSTLELPSITSFIDPGVSKEVNDLIVRSDKKQVYLCSPDGRNRFAIQSENLSPLKLIKNRYEFSFRRDGDMFNLLVRNPRLENNDKNDPFSTIEKS